MQLVASPLSPFVRKVRVLLIEAGLTDQVEVVNVTTTPLETDAQAAAANPLGKIPALIREDGAALHDSRVISRYLDTQAGGGFYPPARLWEVLTLEATAEGMMDAAVLMAYETRFRPEDKQHAPWIEAQWAKIARALDVIEARWMSHLAGPLDMSHVAAGCALGYLDLRHDARGWRKGRPAIEAWYAEFSQRDSMARTAPD
jgi:glutathione S-transferase